MRRRRARRRRGAGCACLADRPSWALSPGSSTGASATGPAQPCRRMRAVCLTEAGPASDRHRKTICLSARPRLVGPAYFLCTAARRAARRFDAATVNGRVIRGVVGRSPLRRSAGGPRPALLAAAPALILARLTVMAQPLRAAATRAAAARPRCETRERAAQWRRVSLQRSG